MKSLIRSHTGCVKSIRHRGALSDPEIWVAIEAAQLPVLWDTR